MSKNGGLGRWDVSSHHHQVGGTCKLGGWKGRVGRRRQARCGAGGKFVGNVYSSNSNGSHRLTPHQPPPVNGVAAGNVWWWVKARRQATANGHAAPMG